MNCTQSLSTVDTIVFDKTGTITLPNESSVTYEGDELNEKEKEAVFAISKQSSHPLSKVIAEHLNAEEKELMVIDAFEEVPGRGLSAMVNNVPIKIGSLNFSGCLDPIPAAQSAARVYINIDDELKGNFSIGNQYRKGIGACISALKKSGYSLQVLSGDNEAEEKNLHTIFGSDTILKFKQKPLEKLEYVKEVQAAHKKILMIGDGLNDSGALLQADVGISINNNNAHFTPACDAILAGEKLVDLNKFLRFARLGKKIVRASFIISVAYNIIGVSFAVMGKLSPMVAAVLMPVSSITSVVFVILATNLSAKKYRL